MSAVETTSPRSAEAGHWGTEVRSDAHVAFEARDRGGVEISLESRVAPYYGCGDHGTDARSSGRTRSEARAGCDS